MLVLSRRTNEEVTFPELGITVEVIQVRGSTVRLGIKAPKDILILRGEIGFLANQWNDHETEMPTSQTASRYTEAS